MNYHTAATVLLESSWKVHHNTLGACCQTQTDCVLTAAAAAQQAAVLPMSILPPVASLMPSQHALGLCDALGQALMFSRARSRPWFLASLKQA
jgi:hypothetical protein